MSTVYKKFTAQDIAVVPFNAHKQYVYTSASAATSSISYFNTRWTSESIYTWTSGSSGGSASLDTINVLKYQQLDHLFYRNFKRDINTKLGNTHYLLQKRSLYNKANILSIPSGLCGSEIKPSSFYLSSSIYEIVDDSNGNLIVSGTNVADYNTDIRTNVLRIGPEKGFKRYDLNTVCDEFEAGIWYRRGKRRINPKLNYSTPGFGDEYDDSYYFNLISYKNMKFQEGTLNSGTFPTLYFNHSEIKISNDEKFHFNKGDDFTISLWVNISSKLNNPQYLIGKSKTRTVVPSPTSGQSGYYTTFTSGALQLKDVEAASQFPFEIYAQDGNGSVGNFIYFSRADLDGTGTTVSASFTTASWSHITCRSSASQMEIFINGVGSGTSGSDNSEKETQNNANIYIGNQGGRFHYLTGSLSQINIYDDALSSTQILNHYSSSNSSPYVGNIFYQNGMVTITHPNYQDVVFDGSNNKELNLLKFQGTHLMYENEYQCTVQEHEYNHTMNISARKIRSRNNPDMASWASGEVANSPSKDSGQTIVNTKPSITFKPYVTTIGLYTEEGDLLVVGKLGQPVKMSDETDTTFILRWDT